MSRAAPIHSAQCAAATPSRNELSDSGDPIADLRAAWHTHVGFGLANAALFSLIADPGRGSRSPAAAAGMEVLRNRARLLSMAPQYRDPGLANGMYDAVMQTIPTNAPALPDESTTAAAVTFRTLVPHLATLSDAERALLSEWLDRASTS